jgi:hypothetical protein
MATCLTYYLSWQRSLSSQEVDQRLPPSQMLTAAVGNPEHPGRVRGYSGCVGKKKIYGKSKRSGASHANCISKEEWTKEKQMLEERWGQQVQTLLAQLWGQQVQQPLQGQGDDYSPRESNHNTQVGSNNMIPDTFQNLEVSFPISF